MGGIFNTNQSLEEMLDKMDNSQGVIETIHAGAVFINYKLQKKLLDSQKEHNKKQLFLQEKLVRDQEEYNKKQLFWSRILSLATIALVVVTFLLVNL